MTFANKDERRGSNVDMSNFAKYQNATFGEQTINIDVSVMKSDLQPIVENENTEQSVMTSMHNDSKDRNVFHGASILSTSMHNDSKGSNVFHGASILSIKDSIILVSEKDKTSPL